MATTFAEPDRLREMLADADVARLREWELLERSGAWNLAESATKIDDADEARWANEANATAEMFARAADALEAVPRLRERVAALEAALRDARQALDHGYWGQEQFRAADLAIGTIDALLSGSTTLAEHDAKDRPWMDATPVDLAHADWALAWTAAVGLGSSEPTPNKPEDLARCLAEYETRVRREVIETTAGVLEGSVAYLRDRGGVCDEITRHCDKVVERIRALAEGK